MAQVLNASVAEEALGTLEDEAVDAKGGEDCAHVLEMFRRYAAVDQDVVEENQHEAP